MIHFKITECRPQRPPNPLDGAKVLMWAFSVQLPFYHIQSKESESHSPVFGLAVAQYPGDQSFYAFGCNFHWKVVQDSHFKSIEEAISHFQNLCLPHAPVWYNNSAENSSQM